MDLDKYRLGTLTTTHQTFQPPDAVSLSCGMSLFVWLLHTQVLSSTYRPILRTVRRVICDRVITMMNDGETITLVL